MATREEVRATIKEYLRIARQEGIQSAAWKLDADVNSLVRQLDELGVVLKAERELPEPPKEVNDLVEGWRPMALGELSCFKGAIKWMLEAGYCAIAPLIELKEPIAEPEPEQSPKCTACEGRGFIEYEHGLIQVECEVCKGTRIIVIEDGDSFTAIHTFGPEMEGGAEPTPPILIGKISKEVTDDSSSGTGQLDTASGSEHPSKPKQCKKRKTKATARKRSS